MTHIPSIEDKEEDTVHIKLDLRNCTQGALKSMKKTLILWDSGASQSLISEGTIKSCNHLSRIKQENAFPMNFTVGNGGLLRTSKTITFSVSIQSKFFEMTCYVAPTLGGLDIIAGNNFLRTLEANMCFKSGSLRFKSKGIPVFTTKKVTLQPGEYRIVSARANVPNAIKNSELYLKSTRYMSQFMPNTVLVRMHKGYTRIGVKNTSRRPVVLRSEKPIGSMLLTDFGKPASSHPLRYEQEGSDTNTLYSFTNSSPSTRKELFNSKRAQFPHLDSTDPRLSMTDEEILREYIKLDGNCMSKRTITKFWQTIMERKTAFAIHDELGDVDLKIKIELKDDSPFYIRPFPASEKEKEAIDKEIDKLVKMGVLKLGKGSYVSPMLLVKKKSPDGTPALRPVSDFRHLNSRIMPLHYCSPLLRDALQLIGSSEATIFSTIDLKNAFFSLKVAEESQKYLTIAPYPSGRTYQYLRMPQGLSISPTEWSDKIADILSELPSHTKYSLAIADDVIVYSRSQEEHLSHLSDILALFEKHGLKISISKCQFFKKKLDYMGHVITTLDGKPAITPQKSKIDGISKMERPKTPRQTKSFVGMVTYLSMYLPKLQMLLVPFHRITRKNSKFVWTEELQKNFEEIKRLLQISPVLTLPAKEGKFILYVDSSIIGTGGALFQEQNGTERLLGYYSRKFADSARNYSISELECLGIWKIVHAYRYLLRNVHFEIVTDHSALTQISKNKHEIPTHKLRKLFEHLSDYNFTIRYRKGKDMQLADHLSRHPSCDVDDNRPIAFAALSDEICSKPGISTHENTQNMEELDQLVEEEESEDHLMVTTRSSSKTPGDDKSAGTVWKDTLKVGLPAPSRATKTPSVSPRNETAASGSTIVESTTYTSGEAESSPLLCRPQPEPQRSTPYCIPSSISDPVVDRPSRFRDLRSEDSTDSFRNNKRKSLIDLVPDLPTDKTCFRELTPKATEECIRTNKEPADYLFKEPQSLFGDNTSVELFHKHIPKQSEIFRMVDTINKRVITNSRLSVDQANLAKEQSTDPFFKPIYAYLKHNILPDVTRSGRSHARYGRAQNKLMLRAENYVLAEDVLYHVTINKDKGKGAQHLQVRICIPESLEPAVFHMEHDSLFSHHHGVQKTYTTMLRKYYIRNLYEKIYTYIRSCLKCQLTKPHHQDEQPYTPRLVVSYQPMSKLYVDIKHMFPSVYGYKYILVCVCEITRYMVTLPLKTHDAVTVADALYERIVCVHGPPEEIIVDADPCFQSELSKNIWKLLGSKLITISPYNHQSSIAERHIKSISELLKMNLSDQGKYWCRYVQSCAYACNTHVIPRLKYSPQELMFVRPPKPLLKLSFPPLEDMKSTYQEYMEFLKNRLEFIGNSMVEAQKKIQMDQYYKQNEKVTDPTKFREGLLVFLLAPSASEVNTGARKFRVDYIGPLFIYEAIDVNKVILADLEGKILHGVYSTKRLRPGFLRLKHNKAASTIQEVREEMSKSDLDKIKLATKSEIKSDPTEPKTVCSVQEEQQSSPNIIFSLVTEGEDHQNMAHGCTIPAREGEIPAHLTYPSQVQQSARRNLSIGAKNWLTDRQISKVQKKANHMPEMDSELSIRKARFRKGHLEVLMVLDTNEKFNFWLEPRLQPNVSKAIAEEVEMKKLRIVGSPGKPVRELYSI